MSDAACPMEGVVESSDSQESAGRDPEVHLKTPCSISSQAFLEYIEDVGCM